MVIAMFLLSAINSRGHFHIGRYRMRPVWGLLFELKILDQVEELVRNFWTGLTNLSGIPEPGRIWQQFSSQLSFLTNLSLISFSKNNFWLNKFIFKNNFFYETVEIDQIIRNIMFFRSATLPTWRNFLQTRPTKPLKWMKIPKPGIHRLKVRRFWGHLPVSQ